MLYRFKWYRNYKTARDPVSEMHYEYRIENGNIYFIIHYKKSIKIKISAIKNLTDFYVEMEELKKEDTAGVFHIEGEKELISKLMKKKI